MPVIVVENSGDRKLSDGRGIGVSATYAPQQTCPDSCELRNNGCYAEVGRIGLHTHRLNRKARQKYGR